MEYKLFFEVCVKCGPVGKGKYVDKIIAVAANDAKHAAKIARAIPRVKHDHKDAIRYVKEITKEEFYVLKEIQNNDPFFTCKSSFVVI